MKMNEIQFCNCLPKLVDSSQEEQYGVDTQHVLPQIVSLQKYSISTCVVHLGFIGILGDPKFGAINVGSPCCIVLPTLD